ncbi:MAG TPA: hypothetical protein V6C57_07205 [Coleofasciculaceae cyanobacterium]
MKFRWKRVVLVLMPIAVLHIVGMAMAWLTSACLDQCSVANQSP